MVFRINVFFFILFEEIQLQYLYVAANAPYFKEDLFDDLNHSFGNDDVFHDWHLKWNLKC